MSLFHSILSQLQEKISKETMATENVAHIISTVVGTTVTKEQITIEKNTVRIKASPTVKMALLLQQKKIIEALKENKFDINTIA